MLSIQENPPGIPTEALHFLGLGARGHDALVLEKHRHHVADEGLAETSIKRGSTRTLFLRESPKPTKGFSGPGGAGPSSSMMPKNAPCAFFERRRLVVLK